MAPRRPRTAQDGPKTAPDGPKTAPRRPQDGPGTAQDGPRTLHLAEYGVFAKIYKHLKKINDFCHPYGTFWRFERVPRAPQTVQDGRNRPKGRPRTAQEAPKTAQKAPKTAHEAPKTAQEVPKTAQEAPKTAPRRPRRAGDHRPGLNPGSTLAQHLLSPADLGRPGLPGGGLKGV